MSLSNCYSSLDPHLSKLIYIFLVFHVTDKVQRCKIGISLSYVFDFDEMLKFYSSI